MHCHTQDTIIKVVLYEIKNPSFSTEIYLLYNFRDLIVIYYDILSISGLKGNPTFVMNLLVYESRIITQTEWL